MGKEFAGQLADDQARVEAVLMRALPEESELDRAMRHAVLAGGKRLRAHLVYETARLCKVNADAADCGAAAIEFMHAYSLVHDDLPAMDDDDMRRGAPTVHVKWNEWMAILAGDALQTLAFQMIGQMPIEAKRAQGLSLSLAHAAGREGMVRGQFLDLQSENAKTPLTIEALKNLHRDKTGALISWSAQFGARAGGIDPTPFAQYAAHLGLAFQIWDDVLDVTASSEDLGKTAGKDEASGKATYVSLLGLEGAKAAAQAEIEAAKTAISTVEGRENLSELADFVITRTY